MSLDELRDMIQQVEDCDGPLVLLSPAGVRQEVGWGGGLGRMTLAALDDPECQDVVAGVLRRDCEQQGLTVVHESTVAWHDVVTFDRHAPPPENAPELYEPKGEAYGQPDTLTAHLRCWLDAHEKGLIARKVEAT